MQIDILPAAGSPGSPFPLAIGGIGITINGGFGSDSTLLDGTQLDQFGEKEVGKFLRGTAQKTYYRGNEGTRLTFSVLRSFNSSSDAESFAFNHRGTVPKVGTLKLTAGGGSNSSDGGKTIPDATIESISIAFHGTSLVITYHCEGGPLT